MEHLTFGVLILLGVSLLGGVLGAWLFQRLRVPQVVGYIVMGLLLGESGLRLIHPRDIEHLRPLTLFSLGIIGFLVGGELRLESFRKYGRQFAAILLGEGVTAFLVVGTGTFLLLLQVLPDWTLAAAGGVVFGAIASATDPASTIDVLWEYRARGVLTTSVTAIVALDDALAMTLYGLGTAAARVLAGGSARLGAQLVHTAVEIPGAILTGFLFAVVLRLLIPRLHREEKALAIYTGLILLLIGICVQTEMDVILAAMTLGFTLVNLAPRRSKKIFSLMRSFSSPIYVLFFVLVGARLTFARLPAWLWGVVFMYVIGRGAGKTAGAWAGAAVTRSADVVRRFLGMSLFAQGGVAIGLSIMASQHLAGIRISDSLTLGSAVIFAVTVTTLIAQIGGPPLVKYAVHRAGEAGKEITEEDVIDRLKVKDVMSTEVPVLHESSRLTEAVDLFAGTDSDVLPVVDAENRVIGTVSLAGMRNVLPDRSSWEWLLAADIMDPLRDKTTPETPLREALDHMNQVHIEQMVVLDSAEGKTLAGLLDAGQAGKAVAGRLLQESR